MIPNVPLTKVHGIPRFPSSEGIWDLKCPLNYGIRDPKVPCVHGISSLQGGLRSMKVALAFCYSCLVSTVATASGSWILRLLIWIL